MKNMMTGKLAVSRAEGSLGRDTKCTALEKRSAMVNTVVLPLDGGSLVTKSRAMWDQGCPGRGRGWKSPAGARWEALLRVQTEQAGTNSLVSAETVGHQKCCLTRNNVLFNPR